jgi:eukaryotic-like serine/threonine-protein kinase
MTSQSVFRAMDRNEPTINLRRQTPKPTHDDSPPAFARPSQIDRYRVTGEIARGGMGLILRARDGKLPRHVAIKLLATPVDDVEHVACFRREAEILGHLQHPGIIPVHDVGTLPDGRPYLVMPLIEGNTLAERLTNRFAGEREVATFLQVFLHVCQTLAYVHSQGFVHRDLKPANVMVGKFGEVLVMDWGLARPIANLADDDTICDCDSVTSTDAPREDWIAGTWGYMSPEQAQGASCDPRSDVFGLGAILCEILTDAPPYVGSDRKSISRLATDGNQDETRQRLATCGADPRIVEIALSCLSPDPTERPENAGDLSERVIEYLSARDNLPVDQKLVPWHTRLRNWFQRT